jgi:hypothetical protein
MLYCREHFNFGRFYLFFCRFCGPCVCHNNARSAILIMFGINFFRELGGFDEHRPTVWGPSRLGRQAVVSKIYLKT